MAMVKVYHILTSTQLLRPRSLSRPASLAAFSSRDKQLGRSLSNTPHSYPAAALFSSPRFISLFLHRVPMETGGKYSALPDQDSKAMLDPELGGGGDDGYGSGPGHGSGDDGYGSGPGHGGDGGDDSSGDSKGNNPGSPFAWYLMLLNKHPVTTKAITSAFLTLFGDFVCQLLIEKNEKINFTRLGIFTLLGLVLVGPTLHFWYLTLSKLVPGPGTVRAGARLVLDQFLFSPIFIGVFLSALMTLEGHSHDIVPKLKQDWLSVVLANWKIWIPFQFLNFLFVPQQLQVLAANIIALAWNTYLSFAAHKDIMPPARRDALPG